MNQPLRRVNLSADQDPNAKLAALLGPAFARYRQAFDRAEGGRRPEAPLHLDVDVTTACNFHCPMCPAGHNETGAAREPSAAGHKFPGFLKGRFLRKEWYSRALAEGAAFGLPSLRLGVTGEPLLVADIDDWVREARAAGVLDVSLITNGRLLTAEMSRRLIAAGLTRLMISVDAGGPETYEKVRPGGDWRRLLENIRDFLRLRREADSPTPLLRLSFVEMEVNRGDREAFEIRFKPLADYLSFQRYQNILGLESTDLGLRDAAGPPAAAGFCAEPFTRLALLVDGGLFPCCSDFGRVRPLGHVAADGLLATWQSAAACFLTTPEARSAEPCRTCLERSAIQTGFQAVTA